jgi:hypothetical protein
MFLKNILDIAHMFDKSLSYQIVFGSPLHILKI